MRDILTDVERWKAEDRPIAIATVVETWGSAPRPAGGKLGLTADGRIAGSVSGGCVENAVVEAGRKTLSSGTPQLLHYGVSDDTAWSVGLACGGSLDVFVERLDPEIFAAVADALHRQKPVAVATVIRGPAGTFGKKLALLEDGSVRGGIDEAALAETRSALAAGSSRRVAAGDREIFVDVLLPAPRLVIVGGVHIAVTLVTLAKTLGFRTDPRRPARGLRQREALPARRRDRQRLAGQGARAPRARRLDRGRRPDARSQARRPRAPRRPSAAGPSTSERSAPGAPRRSGGRG